MNRGYGYWKEYGAEIAKWLRSLTNAGYTVIFIGHEGTREMQDEKGAKYDKIYPRGEKRVVDPIADLCDFIIYVQVQPLNDKGEQVNSTLYLQGTRAFHAGTRFTEVPAFIPQWDMSKLEAVIQAAVEAEERKSNVKAVTFEENKKTLEEAAKSKWAHLSLEELKGMCVEKGGKTIEATGTPEFYQNILRQEFNTTEFQASKAGEQQRPQLEQLLDALIAAGY